MSVKEDARLNDDDLDYSEEIDGAKESVDDIKEYEGDILNALLDSANYATDKSEMYAIRIIRNNTVMFTFHIRPLSEEEYDQCRKKNTKYVRNRRIGIKVPEKTNMVRFRSELIYAATIAHDRKLLWDKKEMWDKLGVLSGVDAIDKILKSGEKDKICNQIDKISGYDDDEIEEVEKN